MSMVSGPPFCAFYALIYPDHPGVRLDKNPNPWSGLIAP